MEPKRKNRKARTGVSVTRVQPELPKQSVKPSELKPSSPEALIRYNGILVEGLLNSPVWREIVFPVLQECIASVSGRFTNGRYWHGSLTNNWKDNNSLFVAGYQKALMDFYNNLHDFIGAKEKLEEKRKTEEIEKKAPLYNPFMEEGDQ